MSVVATVAVLSLIFLNWNWNVEASNSVSAFVHNSIYSNRITIFSKSYCPFVFHLFFFIIIIYLFGIRVFFLKLNFSIFILLGILCVPNASLLISTNTLSSSSLITEMMGIKFRVCFLIWLVEAPSHKYLSMESISVDQMISELQHRAVNCRSFSVQLDLGNLPCLFN